MKQSGSQEWEGKYIPLLLVKISREEVRNGRGNISLSCQLKKQRGSQEWEGKYIPLLSVKEPERNSGMGEEILVNISPYLREIPPPPRRPLYRTYDTL